MRSRSRPYFYLPLVLAASFACEAQEEPRVFDQEVENAMLEKATLGGGCFWCVEAIYHRLDGVVSVVSGYAGGSVENPTYEQVSSGGTGHAEVCQITYDPGRVSYEEILEVFFATHDPTTRDRQGSDFGSQYRSVIFHHDERQKEIAERVRRDLDLSGAFEALIVTEIVPFTAFHPAEDYHQDYFERNPKKPYCTLVVGPKVEKFEKVFANKMKGRRKE